MYTRHCRYLNIHTCRSSYSVSVCQCTVHTSQPKNIETLCNSLTKVVMNDQPSLTADILKRSENLSEHIGDVLQHATSCMVHHFYLATAFNNFVSLNVNFFN